MLAGRPEGTFFEITESGPIWFFNYVRPTDKEIAAMSAGSTFEIRSFALQSVLWVFVKCGDQPWAEAPYNPHMSRNPALKPISDDNAGYALTLVMVDAATQTIKHLRTIGLGNRFSQNLKKDVDELLASPFSQTAYDLSVQKTQAIFTTAQMVKNCRNYWRMG